jgi:ribonuclease P protein component
VAAPRQRFSRTYKLANPKEFRAVLRAGRRVTDATFILLFMQNGLGVARLGVVAPKKNIRLATARNRVKRIVREQFRRHKDRLKGLDIVVVAKKNIVAGKHSMIAASLNMQLQRLAGA